MSGLILYTHHCSFINRDRDVLILHYFPHFTKCHHISPHGTSRHMSTHVTACHHMSPHATECTTLLISPRNCISKLPW